MFALQLGPAVHAQRPGGITDLIGPPLIAAEHIVRRDVHHPGADPGAGGGQDPRADTVDQPGSLRIGLGGVDIGHRRAIDHDVPGPDLVFGG